MPADLSHWVEAELMGRPGSRKRGAEIDFVCVAESCDDTNGSAGWNRQIGAWKCQQCGAKGHTTDLATRLGLRVAPVGEAAGKPKLANFEIERTYDYRDRAGNLIFQICRMVPQPPKYSKDFRQRQPDASKPGGWSWKKSPIRLLYRLPELLASSGRVYLVEGEKDADNLAALGLTATTAPEGASSPRNDGSPVPPKWFPDYTDYLKGRDVVIVVDYDAAGENHATGVARLLHGEAASVRLLRLPNPDKPGFDASDWIERVR